MADTKFGSDWSITHLNAVMRRVQNLEHSTGATVVIEKEIFDQLVKITELASKLNNTTVPFKQIVIDKMPDGYLASIKTEIVSETTAEGSSIVEALLNALHQADRKILGHIE